MKIMGQELHRLILQLERRFGCRIHGLYLVETIVHRVEQIANREVNFCPPTATV